MKPHLVAVLALLLTTLGSMASSESDFEAGNRAFEEKKFLEARQQYEAVVAQGNWTANVFYNLGSANQQIGAEGLAMLNYERALVLNPRHREAFAALDLSRKNSNAKLPPRDWRSTALGLLTFDRWLAVASVAGWLAILLVASALTRRRPLGFGARALVVCSALVAIGAGTAAWQKLGELNAAIVVAKQSEARLAPADRATLADTLPAGSRVEWLNERSGWVECRLPSGSRAWVPASTVERIRLSSST